MNRSPHSVVMSRYYAWHSRIYDATRWAFLFGRDAILTDLQLQPGETVLEIGCGTGRNLEGIVSRVGPTGKVLAIDCAKPMLAQCSKRIRQRGYTNVQLVDQEYGRRPVTGGFADVILLSYSLSMIPEWEKVLECAAQDLKEGGRIGVVDFCLENPSKAAIGFSRWMFVNRVILDRPYKEKLHSRFTPLHCVTQPVLDGLWSFYRFAGKRR